MHRFIRLQRRSRPRPFWLTLGAGVLLGAVGRLPAQRPVPAPNAAPPPTALGTPAVELPDAPDAGTVGGEVTDIDGALIPNAKVTLINARTGETHTESVTDQAGAYRFERVPAGTYRVHISAKGFSPWKVKDFDVAPQQAVILERVELGVEEITTAVTAITVEDLAEQQITNEEHQRILGVLPNFFVSYEKHPMPLTRKQKFKLAAVVSVDPVTFFTTGVTAGIEQANNNFSGYGQGMGGYGQRYAATYGDKLSATFLGAAFFPSLFHQDPRYFYLGHGNVVHRALYAISTTVMCKGDNGHWQPNFSNVLGNIGSAEISTLYYPATSQQSAQVRLTNSIIGIGEGAIGTLFQEFILRHVTSGGIAKQKP
ncbi:Carboxypeptidase regulatory-like domain-containing protein [Bryocella elongata]|uniref:Carboxypeptidase regulatory-like domain-containing protein n=1 Tax=Bryocella elongata TaxID=863522 RepID=A0A1H6CDE8_9BACT|nr:carboxypeptidase-like regulatory domain-containing protein [Bryocella elongata]SEG70386.1 Carboxypeptidase regulatory-like domain-containing protein [Bryocella elongata]